MILTREDGTIPFLTEGLLSFQLSTAVEVRPYGQLRCNNSIEAKDSLISQLVSILEVERVCKEKKKMRLYMPGNQKRLKKKTRSKAKRSNDRVKKTGKNVQ